MNRFSLDNFKIQQDTSASKTIPGWVEHGIESTQKLYHAVIAEVTSIKKRIQNEKNLALKERKLVNTRIATAAGVDKSLISKRRQPKLVEFIAQQNDTLAVLWNSTHKKPWTSGKKLAKDELEIEVRRLKRENKELKNAKMREYLEEAMKAELLHEHAQLAAEISQYKHLYQEAQETIANLRSTLRRLTIKEVG